MAVRPIFLLSLPRTGSTLLQRMLGSHEAVGTSSEPWFLLPLLYTFHEGGVHAEYEHELMARGARGFAEAYLPHGVADFEQGIHDLAIRLYEEAAPGKDWFVDKTPRYHHIAEDVVRLFPEGRFILLWRHPLAVAASIIETFGGGAWNLDRYSADLFDGLGTLCAVQARYGDRLASARYEDLVTSPELELERLFAYIGLPHDPTVVERFTELEMRNPDYWDPTGTRRYRTVSSASIDSWQTVMANPLRKAWCRRYVGWIGEERLALMGYSLSEILQEIDSVASRPRRLPSDLVRAGGGYGWRTVRARVLRTSFPLWISH